MHIILKPESSDLSCGLEFDETVGLKRPNSGSEALQALRTFRLWYHLSPW
jgi:hypothetical protein